jgi:hypothetical protein
VTEAGALEAAPATGAAAATTAAGADAGGQAAGSAAAAAPWQPTWRPGDLTAARFQPMGLLLELVTNSPRILAAAERCFGGYGRPEAARPADLCVRLYEHDVEDADAAGGIGGIGGQRPEPILRCSGRYLYQASGRGSVLVADRALGFAFGYVSPSTAADAPLLTSRFLEAALFYLLECRGFLGIHAAAVARAGRGLLLRGASGQGKTTLAYAAARRGFQALSEDVVWVEVERATWWGAPWTFHLLPDAARLFPELAAARLERQPNGEPKLVVDLETMRAGSTTESARGGPVVLLSRRPGGASRLAELDPESAHREWFAGCAAREREAPGYEPVVAGLLRGGCHRLWLGDDLDTALDLLEPLLP